MSPLRAVVLTGCFALALIGGVAAFNWRVDAQCYYSCPEVTREQRTINTYYRAAQRVVFFPEAKNIILGSSRGETTPPRIVDELTGEQTLNLSTAGAEFATKQALLRLALEKLKVKRVIWLTDYFELIDENQDAKIKNTPALRKYLKARRGGGEWLKSLQGLIDHNTTSASLRFLKKPWAPDKNQGGVGELDPKVCASESYLGPETAESLQAKINILFENYTQQVIKPAQNPKTWELFQEQIRELEARGIDVVVVVLPYHPQFLERLKKDHPQMYVDHMAWIEKLKGLATERVQVANYFDGIPKDDASTKYWNDGVHFTCHGAVKMLEPLF